MVMAVVLYALLTAFRMAFFLHDRTKGTMVVHEALEIARHDESGISAREAEEQAQARIGLMMSGEPEELSLEERGSVWVGQIRCYIWNGEIQTEVYDPENFLRMTSLLDLEGEPWMFSISGK